MKLAPLRVLIVDDEPAVLFLLDLQLSEEPDIDVVGKAANGAEAVDRCHELRPDAVVMDLLMPGTNGFQAIERLRRELPDIHVVAYTAVAGEYVRAEMDRFRVPLVLKSGDVTNLLAALRSRPPRDNASG